MMAIRIHIQVVLVAEQHNVLGEKEMHIAEAFKEKVLVIT